MSDSPSRGRLAALGAYGFEAQEPVILAVLTSGDPLLLVGRSGTGKTFLLNSISEALGLEHRHYNASLISFDDLVGFPYPDDDKTSIRFLETPATVWGPSRCWWTRSAAASQSTRTASSRLSTSGRSRACR
jgi:MoxR-like ATPase